MKLYPYQKQQVKQYGIIAAVALLPLAGFGIGVWYGKGHAGVSSLASESGNRTSMMDQGFVGGRFGQRMAPSTITTVSDTSISVKSNSSTKTYGIDSSTKIIDGQSTIKASDLAVGDTVRVIADVSDSTKASSIIRNPQMMGSQRGATSQLDDNFNDSLQTQ